MRPTNICWILSITFVFNPAFGAQLTTEQKKELMLFGMKAMGLNVGVEDIKNVPNNAGVEKVVATGINLNGHLCASLKSIRPLEVESAYEVTCVAYRGGSARKDYVVDALEGTAFVP
jgi:hypothetical protein